MKYEKPGPLSFLKNQVFQFRVELLEISPPIWRRILVPSDYNFWDLHVAIQDSMGWEDRHLHYFEIKARGKGMRFILAFPILIDYQTSRKYSQVGKYR